MTAPLLIFPDPDGSATRGYLVFREPLVVFSGPELERARSAALEVGGVVAGGRQYGPAESTGPGWWGVFARAERFGHDDLLAWTAEAVPGVSPLSPEWTAAEFRLAGERVREALRRGDSYQINLTFGLRGRVLCASWSWRTALRLWLELLAPQRDFSRGQGHQGAFAWWGDDQPLVVSLSPELFFERRGGVVVTRPMKGTARRQPEPEADAEARARLADSAKDRAENLMITDMLRNDLGRLALPGGVSVPRLFDIEAYPTVWQMTSTVQASLPPATGTAQLFHALFPCASIVGAPKLRSQDLIADIEASPRGWYTGTLGWSTGAYDHFNVLIRTLVFESPRQPEFRLGVGGGHVWDSDLDDEYAEALAKSRFLAPLQRDFDLVESLLWEPEGYFLQARHEERLRGSCQFWGQPWDEDGFRRVLGEVAATLEGMPHKVRVALSPQGTWAATASAVTPLDEPLSWSLARLPLGDDELLHRVHKTSRREVYTRSEVDGVQQTLFYNGRGEITESSTMNVALKIDGTWFTPALSSGLLAGTYRAQLLAEKRLREAVLPLAALGLAEEIAFFNSVRRWVKGKPPRPTLR